MLKEINKLKPFFEDCYRRIHVREYARLMKISPPTASKILKQYKKEEILRSETQFNHILFSANKENKQFIMLSRIYWENKLSPLLNELEKKLLDPTIILFGSLAKGETKIDSDIDIAIVSHKKHIDLTKFEKKLKRNIQPFFFESVKAIKSKELTNNILNGYILRGRVKL